MKNKFFKTKNPDLIGRGFIFIQKIYFKFSSSVSKNIKVSDLRCLRIF